MGWHQRATVSSVDVYLEQDTDDVVSLDAASCLN